MGSCCSTERRGSVRNSVYTRLCDHRYMINSMSDYDSTTQMNDVLMKLYGHGSRYEKETDAYVEARIRSRYARKQYIQHHLGLYYRYYGLEELSKVYEKWFVTQ